MVQADSEMVCPGCGAPISLQDTFCDYCGRKITVVATDFKRIRRNTYRESARFLEQYHGALAQQGDNPQVHVALGYTFIDSGQFEQAAEQFAQVVEQGTQDPDVIFHLALALFRSQKPFSIKFAEAKHIIQFLDNAIDMNPNPQYIYCKAKLVNVLFERRFIKFKQSSAQLLQEAVQQGLSDADRQGMDALLAM